MLMSNPVGGGRYPPWATLCFNPVRPLFLWPASDFLRRRLLNPVGYPPVAISERAINHLCASWAIGHQVAPLIVQCLLYRNCVNLRNGACEHSSRSRAQET